MMNHAIVIEITAVNRRQAYVENFHGVICVEKKGSVKFEVFRSPAKRQQLKMRIYGPYMSLLVDKFPARFYSVDYDNRRIIEWIGDHAEELVLMNSV